MNSIKPIQIISRYYNLTEAPVEDNSNESYEFKEYKEEHGGSVSDRETYRLPMNDINQYTRTKAGLLRQDFQILKSDNSNIAANENVTITNNLINLYQQISYFMNDVEICTCAFIGIKTLVENLLHFSGDYAESAGSNILWFLDTADTTDTNEFIYSGNKTIKLKDADITIGQLLENYKRNPNYNKGFAFRREETKNSQLISVFIPLEQIFGFFKNVDKVFKGVTQRLDITKNSNNNIIHTSTDEIYKLEIKYISWYLPVVKPSLSIRGDLEYLFAKGTKNTIYWQESNVYRSIPSRLSEGTIILCSSQHKPANIYVMFQKDSRRNNRKSTEMLFDNLNVERLQIEVASKRFPEFPYNFKGGNYRRAYLNFLNAGFKLNCDTGTQLSYNTFKNLYPIFHFDLTAMEDSVYSNAVAPQILLDYALKEAPTEDYVVYTMISNERIGNISALDGKISVTT